MDWYLDFDGVLCDSIPEIWATSQRAVLERWVSWEQTDPELRHRFLRLRSFVRKGAEYLSIIRLIQSNQDETIKNFSEWDAYLKKLGTNQLEKDHHALYKVRENWLREEPERWLSLNPPYPNVKKVLSQVGSRPNVIIFSTKKPSYIQAILEFWGLRWHPDHIWEAQGHKGRYLDTLKRPYTLVDDQIEQFSPDSPYGRFVLALWGPISPEAKNRAPLAWSWEEFATNFLNDLI